MPRLRLMCGLAGSGKSTYAKQLEAHGWLRFSIDVEAWDLGYREVPFPDGVAEQIRARQRGQIAEALRAGRDVVVDYSFWDRAQRDEYRALGAGCGTTVEVVFLDVPELEVRRRLAERRHAHADDFAISEDLLAGYLAGFEAPGPDEGDVTVVRLGGA